MSIPSTRLPGSPALRQAKRAWRLQYRESRESIALANKAFARAISTADIAAEGWARLSRGYFRMRYETTPAAIEELAQARRCFEAVDDRAGQILAATGIGRCWWLQGRVRDSLELVLPLRDEGLRLLKHEERGMLLNIIAGGYSSLGQSAEAFAYLYQALRESSPARGHGFDVVLFANLADELYQLGDYFEALQYVNEGIERCDRLQNAHLLSVLLVNRIVCLTDLNRPHDAMPDVRRLLALPANSTGRGSESPSFETMAIAALRAGEIGLGAELVTHAAHDQLKGSTADERIELVAATAELLCARGQLADAAAHLEQALPLPTEGLSLRVHCLFLHAQADVHERLGDPVLALRHLRAWQTMHVERTLRASRARRQAASLHTELLRLQNARDEIDARRRATERAKSELETINRQLSHKVREVESLQAALEQQAVRDFLTGLFNRRHLNDVLPSMFALAQRSQEPLSVAIIDLDHFKEINDRHGHLAGDQLLAAFGELLNRRTRKSDVACRYGGEEFCLLMPRTDARTARRKLEVLLAEWRRTVFAIDGVTVGGNRFSAGVADSRAVPESVDALLKAADNCELDAKRLGRNQVVVFGVPANPLSATVAPPTLVGRNGTTNVVRRQRSLGRKLEAESTASVVERPARRPRLRQAS